MPNANKVYSRHGIIDILYSVHTEQQYQRNEIGYIFFMNVCRFMWDCSEGCCYRIKYQHIQTDTTTTSIYMHIKFMSIKVYWKCMKSVFFSLNIHVNLWGKKWYKPFFIHFLKKKKKKTNLYHFCAHGFLIYILLFLLRTILISRVHMCMRYASAFEREFISLASLFKVHT